MAKLTGKRRFRAKRRLFRKPLLVLQVEEEFVYVYPHTMFEETHTRWRDASVEDQTTVQYQHADKFPYDFPIKPQ